MISSTLISIIAFVFTIIFIIFSDNIIPETKTALFFFFNNVFPVIFPIYVLSSFALSGNLPEILSRPFNKFFSKIFKLPPCALIAVVIGLLSGYPMGAKISSDMKDSGYLTGKEAAILCAFTNNIGPSFAIIIIGKKYLNNAWEGLKFWLAIVLSSLLCGLIICRFANKYYNDKIAITPVIGKRINFYKALSNGLNTSLFIGAVIIFFSSVTSIIKLFPFINDINESIIHSLFELTGGLRKLNIFLNDKYTKRLVLCLFCSWAGISSHIQVCGIMKSSNIRCSYYILLKFIQPVISCFFLRLFI